MMNTEDRVEIIFCNIIIIRIDHINNYLRIIWSNCRASKQMKTTHYCNNNYCNIFHYSGIYGINNLNKMTNKISIVNRNLKFFSVTKKHTTTETTATIGISIKCDRLWCPKPNNESKNQNNKGNDKVIALW